MLSQVLRELQANQGTLRLEELAARVNMEPSALKGIIDLWVSKGRLQIATDEPSDSACPSCGPVTKTCAPTCGAGSCPGAAACPFVAKMPTMYSLRIKD
jgi:hypothetical protein